MLRVLRLMALWTTWQLFDQPAQILPGKGDISPVCKSACRTWQVRTAIWAMEDGDPVCYLRITDLVSEEGDSSDGRGPQSGKFVAMPMLQCIMSNVVVFAKILMPQKLACDLKKA